MSSSSFYNTIASCYDDYCETSHINDFLEEEVLLVESFRPTSILEFGIGTGRFASAYLSRNRSTQYVGVDDSHEMLSHISDMGVTCIHSDFCDYIQLLIHEKKTFDCIVAPYTALHHIPTENQIQLFENMQKVARVIILNCLSEKIERELFTTNSSTEVTFLLPGATTAKTTIHKIHPTLRSVTRTIQSGNERVYLLFKQYQSVITAK